MYIFLLILHGLLAVALLGAVTHQTIGIWLPAKRAASDFTSRARSVSAPAYTRAILVLYVLTALLGGVIYAEYRISIRVVIEQLEYWKSNGAFELKEHLVAIGLGVLPAYAYAWRQPLDAALAPARRALTLLLALVTWWGFIVGHIINNLRGFEP